ncbi:MAG: hypothetical protein WC479_03210 [Candidatus Izemoplasmatales bacterium]
MKKTFLLLLFILSFAFVGLIPVMAEGASQSEATTTVSLTAYFDNENIIEQGSVVSTFGTNDGYTISKTDFEDYSFVWWVVNGVLYDSVELTGEFMVTSDMHIVAVFKPLNTFAVVFVDTN